MLTPEQDRERLRQRQESMRESQERLQAHRKALQTTEGQSELGIPPQYHGAKLDEHPHGEFIEAWLNAPDSAMVVLTGPAGTGKTRMLYAVRRHLLWNMLDQPVVNVPEFCFRARIAATADGQDRFYTKTLTDRGGVLLLDDLGAEKVTDFVLQELHRLISNRELWGRPTMITTNLSIDQIAEKLDDRIASRLAGGEVLVFGGEDKRLKQRRTP